MITDKQRDDLLRDFYRDRLLPLALIARERGLEFFPLSGDASAASYYKDRIDGGNYVHEIDSANLASELESMWQDFPELAALSRPLVELADKIKEDEGSTEDVSPFIYAMF